MASRKTQYIREREQYCLRTSNTHSLIHIWSDFVKMDILSTSLKIALVATMPFSLAAPAGDLGAQDIQITLEKSLQTSETELSVTDQSGTNILASSCSDHLDIPRLNTSVTANVDDHGSGTLKVGGVVYNIHENINTSGGISCNRMYTDEQVFVMCDLLSRDALSSTSLALLRRSDTPQTDCFTTRKRSMPETRSLKDHAMVMINAQAGSIEPQPALDAVSNGDITTTRSMDKRQGACGLWSGTTKPVSNPDPHQNYYLKQLSVSP